MAQTIHIHHFENGLTLLAEPMDWLESAAFVITTPAGSSRDPVDQPGLGNFTGEMVQRGCGEMDSRQFTNTLENLGVVFDGGVANNYASFRAAMPADKLDEALPLFADQVRRPLLPEDQMEEALQVCIQEIRGIEDDLAGRAIRELRKRIFPDPYGRPGHGTVESVSAISIDDVRRQYQNCYGPQEAVVSVAGKIDWPALRDSVGELFGDWRKQPLPALAESPPETGYLHIPHDSSQTHVAIGYPSIPYAHEDFYQARGAVGVLSDGMSSRLFTEVRENRGLCYSVYAQYHSLRQMGSVECYVGTTTDKAQESLDVVLQQLTLLADGVEERELQRFQARYKSALIMQQESSMSRTAHITADWRLLGRVRTLAEVSSAVDGLTCATVNSFLKREPPADFRVVTLGAKSLEIPLGVS